jgi:hypothetical protein
MDHPGASDNPVAAIISLTAVSPNAGCASGKFSKLMPDLSNGKLQVNPENEHHN